MSKAGKREKIVILGGGMASMTAAFELTDREGWQDKYDVTVYQLGWRLGGKGASGRRQEAHQRIEEHGLHIWLGFYDNAFNLIQRCYRQLGRSPDKPLATWQAAFKPHTFIVFEEHIKGRWIPWPVEYPTNDLVPGHAESHPSPWQYISEIIELMRQTLADSPYATAGAAHPVAAAAEPPWWERIATTFGLDLGTLSLHAVDVALGAAHRLVRTLEGDHAQHPAEAHHALLWLLKRFMERLWHVVEADIVKDDVARRLWIALDLLASAATGMIVDGVIFHGFDVIDDYDFRQWLRKHGASDLAVNSAWVRSGYDLVFGFRKGDISQPNLAAGTGLRGALRMLFNYKGAVAWKMQAGMGDTIFTPVYEVLKKRGVHFKFFHRVKELHLSADGKSIGRIAVGRQVNLKNGDYDPLVTVKDLPCWPSEPLYDQLVEGDKLLALKKKGKYVNLESAWTSWKDVGELTLTKGKDFDRVVLGISLAALPFICPELIAAKKEWRNMVDHVETVRTQAFQLWLKPSLAELGWRMPTPIVGGYVEPLDTWADMTHLLPMEDWPAAYRPGNLAYFCGPMKDSKTEPPFTNAEFPRKQANQVKKNVIDFLKHHTRELWPDATRSKKSEELNWELLVDLNGGRGQARLNAQFWRANIDPTERYVLSVAGSTKYRLKAGQSGFDNLYLAGDWTYNGVNAGCIEGTVLSGMQACRAIAGYPKRIIGESDF